MLFNEPKLLKSSCVFGRRDQALGFSALQRAEIAEIVRLVWREQSADVGFSALQRAEIAEIAMRFFAERLRGGFSALQRAEIAEIGVSIRARLTTRAVSVLFNEPKLLKFCSCGETLLSVGSFSALQRAEIAEIEMRRRVCIMARVSVLFNEPKLLKSGLRRA